jgi:hypothetical protein
MLIATAIIIAFFNSLGKNMEKLSVLYKIKKEIKPNQGAMKRADQISKVTLKILYLSKSPNVYQILKNFKKDNEKVRIVIPI